jgi:hypothetical protein
MLDPDKVKADVDGIKAARASNNLSNEDFEAAMTSKFPYLAENAKTLFSRCCTGDMDDTKINYMINMMRKVISGKKSEHDASVNIGQRLVDEYVMPLIKDKK